MPKCIFQRHISPERYLITPFDQFLSSFPCCQFVTAFTLLFQIWSTGTVSTILHDSAWIVFLLYIFINPPSNIYKIVYFTFFNVELKLFQWNTAQMWMWEWMKKSVQRRLCPFSIFIGTKMPFESWYSRGMACEHLNIFIFPGWSEFIWSQH